MFEGGGGHVVEDEAHVLKGKEPGVFGRVRAVEECVGDAFDILPTSFSSTDRIQSHQLEVVCIPPPSLRLTRRRCMNIMVKFFPS